jgi:hypothetical protein
VATRQGPSLRIRPASRRDKGQLSGATRGAAHFGATVFGPQQRSEQEGSRENEPQGREWLKQVTGSGEDQTVKVAENDEGGSQRVWKPAAKPHREVMVITETSRSSGSGFPGLRALKGGKNPKGGRSWSPTESRESER